MGRTDTRLLRPDRCGPSRPAAYGAFLIALLALPMVGPADEPAPSAKVLRERLLGIYAREAAGYAIYRDATRAEEVTLRKEPVYVWTNPTRERGQDGAVFVWTCRGRPEVVGTFFSFPSKGPRGLDHEFHALSTTVLDVTRPGAKGPDAQTWAPRVPGVTMTPIPGAPAPERLPAPRFAQMRELTRAFSGETRDREGQRWELRLLPQPLYRYESTDPDVLDGALFAFVSSAGTDPEALLLLEARKAPGAGGPTWHYALGRYTDLSLRMRLKGREVLALPLLDGATDPTDRYRVFQDRVIPPVEGEPAKGARE